MIGTFRSTPSIRILACVVVDASIIAGTLCLAVAIRFGELLSTYGGGILKGAFFVVTLLLALYYSELYGKRAPNGVTDLALRLIKAFVTGGIFLAVLYYAIPDLALWRSLLLIHSPLALTALLGWRISYYWVIQRDAFVENVLILGTGNSAVRLAREVLQHQKEGYRVIGFLGQDLEEVGKSLFNPTVVGTFEELLPLADKFNIHSIVVALEEQRSKLPLSDLLTCKVRGVHVTEASEFFEELTGQLPVRNLRPSALIFSPGFRRPRFFNSTRQAIERAEALVLLVLAIPFLMLGVLLILLEDGLPLLFRQERVGENDKTFTLYKLRTMQRDAEHVGPVSNGDPRVLRVGRFLRNSRIDELPQLFNVLRGDMSFVGPRPERPCFVEKLATLIPYYWDRHTVKPGITGWAQVRYGYSSSVEESEIKLRYDLYYVKNMNFWLDVQIVLDTAKVILFGRGAR